MQLKIGVIGSCTSRDPFTTFFNKDYKTFFKVAISAQRTSVISFMSEPFNYDENSIKVIQNGEHIFQRTKNLAYDFNRCAFKELQQNEIDYLIIDNYFEAAFGIMCINNQFMVTNNTALYHTEFLNSLKEKKTITIGKNTNEYFKLYKKYCDKFFEYMETNLPNVGIILNKPRLVYNVLTKDGELYIEEKYKSCSEKYNPFLLEFDKYIEKNYEVDTIEFDKDTLAYENHRWGKAAVHYIDSYYTNFIEDVKYICLSDRIRKLNNNLINKSNKEENLKKSSTQEDINETNNLFDVLNNINQLFDEFNNLDDKNSLVSKYNSLLEENKSIMDDNVNLVNLNEAISEENRKLSLDVGNKSEEIKRLLEANKSFSDDNVNLVNLNEAVSEENRKLSLDVGNKSEEIKRLSEENESLINLNKEMKKLLFDLNLNVKYNEEKINHLKKKNEYLQTQINEYNSDSNNFFRNVKKYFK